MSKARLLAPWVGEDENRSAIYHCISRIVGRELLLRREEKEQFVRYMRLYEEFCGVRVCQEQCLHCTTRKLCDCQVMSGSND